jgi:type IV secretion system protein VirB11
MISRIKDLLREVIPGELPDIAQSVQLLVHLKPTNNGPVVDEILETNQLGKK